jgi:hypothetical protein
MGREWDHIARGEVADQSLGYVSYYVTSQINVSCPNCGNPDCAEVGEFKERLKAQLWPPESDSESYNAYVRRCRDGHALPFTFQEWSRQ